MEGRSAAVEAYLMNGLCCNRPTLGVSLFLHHNGDYRVVNGSRSVPIFI